MPTVAYRNPLSAEPKGAVRPGLTDHHSSSTTSNTIIQTMRGFRKMMLQDKTSNLVVDFVTDYTLSLFPEDFFQFPRQISNNPDRVSRHTVFTNTEFLNAMADTQLVNCFVCSHSEYEVWKGILSILFIDIDKENDPDLAHKLTSKTAKRIEQIFNVEPLVQFSGKKGFHILLPMKPVKLGVGEARAYLKFMQTYLSSNHCDTAVRGDINRLFRMPWSIHPMSKREVRVLQEWSGERADPSLLYGDFEIERVKERFEAKEKFRREGLKPKSVTNEEHRYAWIETLLKTGIPDGRHRSVLWILAPYLIMINGYAPEDATLELRAWVELCDKAHPVAYDVLPLIEYRPKNVYQRFVNNSPIKFYRTLEQVKDEDTDLHNIIRDAF